MIMVLVCMFSVLCSMLFMLFSMIVITLIDIKINSINQQEVNDLAVECQIMFTSLISIS